MTSAPVRLDDPSLAQDPLPAIEAFGVLLAEFHNGSTNKEPRTPIDLIEARETLSELHPDGPHPHLPTPYNRIAAQALAERLDNQPKSNVGIGPTHGAAIVGFVTVTKQGSDGPWQASLLPSDSEGRDPAERDLAIAARSVAETFAPEAVATLLAGYEQAGGRLPDAALLDWYAMVAALR